MKKCIAMLIATIMLTAGLLSVSASQLLFINESDEQYFDVLTNLGVLSLYQDEEGFFDGGKEVSRGEAAMAIAGLLNLNTGLDSSIGTTFIDVLPSEPASGSIAAMVSLKAMNGFGDNLFRPYDAIQSVHFVKALLAALGYGWRADYAGGFPTGYLKIANEVNLLEGITIEDNQPLTRSVLFKILYNSLDVQVFDVAGVSSDSTLYETSKETTVLTKYHNIYEETAVVNSNSMTSLNDSFKANEDSVLLGTERVKLQEDKSIWSYLGQNVTYFYQQEDGSTTKTLISFALDDNEIITLTEATIDAVSGNTVAYIADENGKIRKLSYNLSTDVVYNGGRDAVNLKEKLENLSGTADFIDNDEDGIVDVIIMNDYHYDAVYSVNATDEIVYCNGESINLDAKDAWVIESENGNILALEELAAGDVMAIAESETGKMVRLVRLASTVTGKAMQRGNESITVDETAYNVSAGCNEESLAKVKLGSQYTFYLNQAGEIVYVAEASASSLKTGYLIEYGQESNAFDSKIFLKVLVNGSVDVFETKEKLQLNGTMVESKNLIQNLKTLKSDLNLASDGAISQVIRFSLDSNDCISSIYTAKVEDNDYLTLKLNTEGTRIFLREGYGVGRLNNKYFIGTNTTIFQVPQTNQESYDDEYYFNIKLKNEIRDGQSYILETYTIGDSVMPAFAVCYNTSVAGFAATTDLLLVDTVEKALNAEGEQVSRITGYIDGARTSYDSDSQIDMTGLSRGDTVVLKLTATNKFTNWAKVYDAGDKTFGIDPDSGASYESSELDGARQIMLMSVYRREGGYIEATNKGFADLDVALDNMYALDLSRIGKLALYDSAKDEISVVTTDSIIDYLHDNTLYTKMLIRYQSGYLMNCIIYK